MINKVTGKVRKCNYPLCEKDADFVEPFGGLGSSDAYCKEHQEKRDKLFV